MAATGPNNEIEELLQRGLIQLFDGRVQDAIVTWMKILDLDAHEPRALDYLETLEAIEPRSPIEGDGGNGLGVEESGEFAAHASPFTSQQSLDVVPSVDGDGGGFVGGPLSDEEKAKLLGQVTAARGEENLGGALDICEEILKRSPGDPEVEELAREIKEDLVNFYLDQLKPLDQIPRLVANDASILELSLDPIGGFLLSQIDGNITVEELLTIMGTFEQYRVVSALHYFLNAGIIELKKKG
jgi:hypothetical protein